MKKVRWGVLSTAKIATVQVIPAMRQCQFAEVVGIASRDAAKAEQAAAELGLAKSYGSYEALLADPDIDAVYNPLPNHLHVPLSIQALAAGKHVLCEKPIGLSVEDALTLVEAGERYPHLKLMEAFMYRHHPQWLQAKQWVDQGRIGALRTIQTFFSYYNRDPENIRHRPEWGGGALMDIGCYPISLSRWLFDDEPRRVQAWLELDPDFQVDRHVVATMQFDAGVATFTCSTQVEPYQRVNIVGSSGRIEIEIPFNAPIDRPCKLWLHQGDSAEQVETPVGSQYTIQGDLLSRAILDDAPVPTPLEDAIANMRVIEAIFAAAESGSWVELAATAAAGAAP